MSGECLTGYKNKKLQYLETCDSERRLTPQRAEYIAQK